MIMIFNASKSKCVVCSPQSSTQSCRLHTPPQFCISGNSTEVVDSWPHLGHIICKNSDDNRDVLNRRSLFRPIAQANIMPNMDSVKADLRAPICSNHSTIGRYLFSTSIQ